VITEKTRAPLIFQVRVKAAPSVVFSAFFQDPVRWLCRDASLDLRVGGQIRMCWPDGCFEGKFVQCDPPTVGRFSWRMQGDTLPETMVVVSMDPVDGEGGQQTALELEHYGFGTGPDWDPMYVGAVRAWAAYLKNLRAVLETGVDLREDDE
jgi:uncharacterized protein YndB with AHSA1/START domain